MNLDLGPDPIPLLKENKYALFDAAYSGDIDTLERCFDEDEDADFDCANEEEDLHVNPLKDRNNLHYIPLHIAVLNGHLGCIRTMLENESPVLSIGGLPLIHAAVHSAMHEPEELVVRVIKVLHSYGTKIMTVNSTGQTAFHLAAIYDLPLVAEMLLKFEKSFVNRTDSNGDSAVILAAKHGSSKFLEFLDENSDILEVNWNHKNNNHENVFHNAFTWKRLNVLRILLKHVSSEMLEETNSFGESPKSIAKEIFGDKGALLYTKDALESGDIDLELDITHNSDCKSTTIFYDRICQEHATVADWDKHSAQLLPENPRRFEVLVGKRGILTSNLIKKTVNWKETERSIDIVDLLRVHDHEYVFDMIRRCNLISNNNQVASLDHDTNISNGSQKAALHAAGCVLEAADDVINGHTRNAMCIVRPPGHHAGPSGVVPNSENPEISNGFCLFNNVAAAAAYCKCVHRHKISKVAIVDFDVHHGNGTEAIVRNLTPRVESYPIRHLMFTGELSRTHYKPWLNEKDKDEVLFVSTHGYGRTKNSMFYPGSGAPNDVVLNVPFGEAQTRHQWKAQFRDVVCPKLMEFNPDIIFISAGFDAHIEDPLSDDFGVVFGSDFEKVTRDLQSVANECCEGRMISVLEGGYNIRGDYCSPLALSVHAHVRGMADPSSASLRWNFEKAAYEREWEAKQLKLAQEKLEQELTMRKAAEELRKRQLEEEKMKLKEEESMEITNEPNNDDNDEDDDDESDDELSMEDEDLDDEEDDAEMLRAELLAEQEELKREIDESKRKDEEKQQNPMDKPCATKPNLGRMKLLSVIKSITQKKTEPAATVPVTAPQPITSRRSSRKRSTVDYTQLSEQMDAEAREMKRAKLDDDC